MLQLREKMNRSKESLNNRLRCNDCIQFFKTKTSLAYHQHKASHGGLTPFQCEQCGKGFGIVNHLINHLRTHTKQKPFFCPVHHCTKTFARVDQVNGHLGKLHKVPYKVRSRNYNGRSFKSYYKINKKKVCISRIINNSEIDCSEIEANNNFGIETAENSDGQSSSKGEAVSQTTNKTFVNSCDSVEKTGEKISETIKMNDVKISGGNVDKMSVHSGQKTAQNISVNDNPAVFLSADLPKLDEVDGDTMLIDSSQSTTSVANLDDYDESFDSEDIPSVDNSVDNISPCVPLDQNYTGIISEVNLKDQLVDFHNAYQRIRMQDIENSSQNIHLNKSYDAFNLKHDEVDYLNCVPDITSVSDVTLRHLIDMTPALNCEILNGQNGDSTPPVITTQVIEKDEVTPFNNKRIPNLENSKDKKSSQNDACVTLNKQRIKLRFDRKVTKYKCSKCEFECTVKAVMLIHFKKTGHCSKTLRSFTCELCPKKFVFKNAFFEHVKNCKPVQKDINSNDISLEAFSDISDENDTDSRDSVDLPGIETFFKPSYIKDEPYYGMQYYMPYQYYNPYYFYGQNNILNDNILSYYNQHSGGKMELVNNYYPPSPNVILTSSFEQKQESAISRQVYQNDNGLGHSIARILEHDPVRNNQMFAPKTEKYDPIYNPNYCNQVFVNELHNSEPLNLVSKCEEQRFSEFLKKETVKLESDNGGPPSIKIKQSIQCFECGAVFSTKTGLSYHRHKFGHDGYIPYSCLECPLNFGSTGTLKTHVKSHVNSKFNCNLCRKIFSRLDELKSHLNTGHKIREYLGKY